MDLRDMQRTQPWTVPYSPHVQRQGTSFYNHAHAQHTLFHVMKTAGKIAAVFEAFDHSDNDGAKMPSDAQIAVIRDMACDLVTEALRFANLYRFDLESHLKFRTLEKNGVGFGVKP